MTRAQAIAAACLLDWIAGDPEWCPHPVRWMGRCTQLAESLLRRPGQSVNDELMMGAALTAGLVGASYLGTATSDRYGLPNKYSDGHDNRDPTGMDMRCVAQPGR